VTLIWGMYDPVFAAPGGELRVEPVPDVQARRQPLYFIPDANHYLQVDRPTRLRKSSCTRSNPLAARHPAPSRRDWALPCWSIPLANGCRPQQMYSAPRLSLI